MTIEVTQCSMCKHYSEEQYCEIWQQYITNDAFYCACGAKADRKPENSSEKPNNCEHITEDGVTCAKYPACDDCPDNPLNKLKGSERLVKGSEQTDLVEDSPSLVKDLVKAFGEDGTWLERQGVYTLTLAEAKQRAVDIIESVLAKDEPTISKMEQVEDEFKQFDREDLILLIECQKERIAELLAKDEPQTDDLQDWKDRMWAEAIVTEPQTCSVNGRPYDCGNCEYFKCTADEPQAEVIMPKKCKGCDSASKIIEAYSRGFEDGAEAVKAMPQTGRSE